MTPKEILDLLIEKGIYHDGEDIIPYLDSFNQGLSESNQFLKQLSSNIGVVKNIEIFGLGAKQKEAFRLGLEYIFMKCWDLLATHVRGNLKYFPKFNKVVQQPAHAVQTTTTSSVGKRKADLDNNPASFKRGKTDIASLEGLYTLTPLERNKSVLGLQTLPSHSENFLQSIDHYMMKLLNDLRNKSIVSGKIHFSMKDWKKDVWFQKVLTFYIEYYLVRYFSSLIEADRLIYFEINGAQTTNGQGLVKTMKKIQQWPDEIETPEVHVTPVITYPLSMAVPNLVKELLIKDTGIVTRKKSETNIKIFSETQKKAMFELYESLEVLAHEGLLEKTAIKQEKVQVKLDNLRYDFVNNLNLLEYNNINNYFGKKIVYFYIDRILMIRSLILNKQKMPNAYYQLDGKPARDQYGDLFSFEIEAWNDVMTDLRFLLSDQVIDSMSIKNNILDIKNLYEALDREVDSIIRHQNIEKNEKIKLIKVSVTEQLNEVLKKLTLLDRDGALVGRLSQHYLEKKWLTLNEDNKLSICDETHLVYYDTNGKSKFPALAHFNEKASKIKLRNMVLDEHAKKYFKNVQTEALDHLLPISHNNNDNTIVQVEKPGNTKPTGIDCLPTFDLLEGDDITLACLEETNNSTSNMPNWLQQMHYTESSDNVYFGDSADLLTGWQDDTFLQSEKETFNFED